MTSSDQEYWLPVPGWGGAYSVSNLGRVESIRSKRILRPRPRGKGYLAVTLCADGRRVTYDVHQLVMLAFCGPCPTGHNINHRDGDKQNPRLSNLEYATFRDNSRHALATGLWRGEGAKPYNRGAKNPHAAINEDVAAEIARRLSMGERPVDVARALNVSKWVVYNIRYKRRWT